MRGLFFFFLNSILREPVEGEEQKEKPTLKEDATNKCLKKGMRMEDPALVGALIVVL